MALAMNELIMRGLGASGEQIDRERDRIREELFGTLLAFKILLPPPPHPAIDDEQTTPHVKTPESDATPPQTRRRLTSRCNKPAGHDGCSRYTIDYE